MDEGSALKGRIHSYESFSTVDGPGIRFVLFMSGCNLRCRYCHNVDTWKTESGKEHSVKEILDYSERYRHYWGADGGITVSGGEPLLQIDFLIELFKEAKQRDINTCIDTAAQPFTKEEPFFSKFRRLMEYTDILLMDIKQIDREKHIALTGCSNDNIKECFSYLNEIGKKIWIRYVLVPGFTDDVIDLKKTRDYIDGFSNIKRVEILPYHTMGKYKYKELGMAYSLEGVREPLEEEITKAKVILYGDNKGF